MRPTNLRFPSFTATDGEGLTKKNKSKGSSKDTMKPETTKQDVITDSNGHGTPGIANSYTAGSGPLPMLTLPSTIRNNLVAALGEFVGTFLFLFFAFAGTQVANMSSAALAASKLLTEKGVGSPPDPPTVTFISLCFGLSLMANVWAFYRVTGGLFNPCVS